jgi:hypothetical protein
MVKKVQKHRVSLCIMILTGKLCLCGNYSSSTSKSDSAYQWEVTRIWLTLFLESCSENLNLFLEDPGEIALNSCDCYSGHPLFHRIPNWNFIFTVICHRKGMIKCGPPTWIDLIIWIIFNKKCRCTMLTIYRHARIRTLTSYFLVHSYRIKATHYDPFHIAALFIFQIPAVVYESKSISCTKGFWNLDRVEFRISYEWNKLIFERDFIHLNLRCIFSNYLLP